MEFAIFSFCLFFIAVEYPTEFFDLYHALDIWHKSVKITKKLTEVLCSNVIMITCNT